MRRLGVLLLLLQLLLAMTAGGLEVGYYGANISVTDDYISIGFCPLPEVIVRQVMERRFYNDNTIAPAIIRMLFHDCFVRGCDASLLIVPTATRSSERVAIPNQTLRGFNIVNAVKSALEAACPGVVSCADTLALMGRDSVVLLGGAAYDVALGRLESLQSNAWEVDLPAPFSYLDDTLRHFSGKGFSAEETVVLFSAHTVGGTHCYSFRYRLAKPDGTMDENLRCDMVGVCGIVDQLPAADAMTFLDPVTPFAVDNAYYAQLMSNRSLLQVDQETATHAATAGYVAYYAANPDAFVQRFSEVMVKLGMVGVLEGDAGEVRRFCTKYNTC